MSLFLVLLVKLLPLYLIMAAGYIVTRVFNPNQKALAPYIVYIVIPLVVFDTIYRLTPSASAFMIPVFIWILASGIAVLWYFLGSRIWKDGSAHVAAFAAGGSNFGYFGIPVAILLFGEEVRAVAVLFLLAYMLYESTVGYAILYPKHLTVARMSKKLLSLPALYAFIAGLMVNSAGIVLPGFYEEIATAMYGAFVVLGALIVGSGFARWKAKDLDMGFLLFVMLAKFIVWPLLAFGLILFDVAVLHLFDTTVHRIIFLMSLVPVAANTVTYATLLNVKPQKAAMVVIVSTLFSLIYIPLMLTLAGL